MEVDLLVVEDAMDVVRVCPLGARREGRGVVASMGRSERR